MVPAEVNVWYLYTITPPAHPHHHQPAQAFHQGHAADAQAPQAHHLASITQDVLFNVFAAIYIIPQAPHQPPQPHQTPELHPQPPPPQAHAEAL